VDGGIAGLILLQMLSGRRHLLLRSAVELAIEKSETTVIQWLKEQTQNN
jgi:hypothetical protein